MKITFWKVIGCAVITSVVANGVVNTVSRIRRNKLEDENYQEEIKRKREEREAKKAEKELAKLDRKKRKVEVANEEA